MTKTAKRGTKPNSLRGRIHSYDLLRGLCAIFVAQYHFFSWVTNKTSYVSPLGSINNAGTYAVYMFFMLSGATMYASYSKRLETSADFVFYYGVRWARILPLYFFVMVLGIVAMYAISAEPDWDFSRFLLNSSLLFGFAVPGEMSIVGGGWSIGIEVVFYTIFPMLLFLMDRKDIAFDLFILIGICILQVTFVNYVISIHDSNFLEAWDYYANFTSFFAYFVFGCFVAKWILPMRRVGSGLVVMCFLLLTLGFIVFPTSGTAASVSGYSGFAFLVISFLIFLMWSIFELPQRMHQAASFFGDISYSVYLLHPFGFKGVQLLSEEFIDKNVLTDHPWRVMFAAMIVTFIAARIVYVYVEKPMLVFFKKKLKKRLAT